jgi:hypothetical protein
MPCSARAAPQMLVVVPLASAGSAAASACLARLLQTAVTYLPAQQCRHACARLSVQRRCARGHLNGRSRCRCGLGDGHLARLCCYHARWSRPLREFRHTGSCPPEAGGAHHGTMGPRMHPAAPALACPPKEHAALALWLAEEACLRPHCASHARRRSSHATCPH